MPAPAPPAWYLAGEGITTPYPPKVRATPPGPALVGQPMLGVDAATAAYELPRTPPPVAPFAPSGHRSPPPTDLAAEVFLTRALPAAHEPSSRAILPGGYYLPPEPSGFGRLLKPPQGI